MVAKCKNGHWYDGRKYSKCPHCEGGNEQSGNTAEDEDQTVSFGFFGMTKLAPVTGWLVCTVGEERGRDFRLHAGRNFVGRSTAMDVVLADDKTISSERHCSVTYDPKGNNFYLASEDGNAVFLNGQAVTQTVLRGGDTIQLGETELIFIPFCEEERRWTDD